MDWVDILHTEFGAIPTPFLFAFRPVLMPSFAHSLMNLAPHRRRWLFVAWAALLFTFASDRPKAEAGCGDYLVFRAMGPTQGLRATERSTAWSTSTGISMRLPVAILPATRHSGATSSPMDSSCPGCQSRREGPSRTPVEPSSYVERHGPQGVLVTSVTVVPPSISSVLPAVRFLRSTGTAADLWRPPPIHGAT